MLDIRNFGKGSNSLLRNLIRKWLHVASYKMANLVGIQLLLSLSLLVQIRQYA